MSTHPQIEETLEVYLQNQLVGHLYSNKGELGFSYSLNYLSKSNAIKLSISFPLQKDRFDHSTTYAFFSGLLPDENVRHRLAKYLGLSEKNIFALLKAIGGECAGAVSVYPKNTHPNIQKERYRVLTDLESHHILSTLDKHPFLVDEPDVRISGAGAQNKLMIAFVDNQIAIPLDGSPSTHIIKPAIKGLEDSVHNEYFCMKLAKNLGLPVPDVDIYWLEGNPYYLIERYDRITNNEGFITRLHQEDFCQALQIPPEIKYENEGGPSLDNLFSLLDNRIKAGLMKGNNKIILLQGIIFNFLIGNGDAHAKNFSLLYKDSIESLAPFYDILSTIVYFNAFKSKMAMKITGKYKFKEVSTRHWIQLGETIGFKSVFLKKQLLLLCSTILEKAHLLEQELNSSAKTASPLYSKIIRVIDNNVKQLQL